MTAREANIELLTDKQKAVLRLISDHLQAKEIARILNISERTVKAHTKAAREKLGVTSSRDAARILAMHDAAKTPVLEGQWPSGAIAQPGFDPPLSLHGQDISPERPIPYHELERAGTGLADASLARKVQPDRDHASDGSSHRTVLRAGQGDLYDRRGDGVVDGRQSQSERLAALSPVSFLRLIAVKAMWMLLIGAGLVMGILGALQAMQSVMRFSD